VSQVPIPKKYLEVHLRPIYIPNNQTNLTKRPFTHVSELSSLAAFKLKTLPRYNGQMIVTAKAFLFERTGVCLPKLRSLLSSVALTKQNVHACVVIHRESLAMIFISDYIDLV